MPGGVHCEPACPAPHRPRKGRRSRCASVHTVAGWPQWFRGVFWSGYPYGSGLRFGAAGAVSLLPTACAAAYSDRDGTLAAPHCSAGAIALAAGRTLSEYPLTRFAVPFPFHLTSFPQHLVLRSPLRNATSLLNRRAPAHSSAGPLSFALPPVTRVHWLRLYGYYGLI